MWRVERLGLALILLAFGVGCFYLFVPDQFQRVQVGGSAFIAQSVGAKLCPLHHFGMHTEVKELIYGLTWGNAGEALRAVSELAQT